MGDTNFDNIVLANPLPVANLGNASIPPAKLSQPNVEVSIHMKILGAVAVGTVKDLAVVGRAGTITGIQAYAETGPVGAAMVLDVMKNGVTVFTTTANRPTIADGGNASTATLPDVTAVAQGDRLRLDVIQVGSGTAGSNLSVAITIKRAPVA